ncbi:hypothetical protein [Alloprevotella tannerae]|uniref:hypothetical protein n=1 Tax=Alloprevotella tannerae TaxID=76122 RepID=UPI0028E4C9BD|nr:hypothetical protein [Alloprevotella tannerae]
MVYFEQGPGAEKAIFPIPTSHWSNRNVGSSIVCRQQTIVWWEQTIVWRQQTIVWWEQTIVSVEYETKKTEHIRLKIKD